MDNDKFIDLANLKYVLYARKSTTTDEQQIRSIKDQIDDCEKRVIGPLELNVVKVFRESQSAKKAGKRPMFNEMIKNLEAGKYDGIVAWHPDRLARNMLEGGQIIDMIDEGKIKDLQFVTHHFTNGSQDKMLLGLSFVLSKQYSDDLSEKITRGTRKSFAEGKAWTPKHGYINKKHEYFPDGKNFELICKAWQMRKDKESLEKIVKYLRDNNYQRKTKSKKRVISMTIQRLSRILKDPFYYGVLIQASQQIDLREMYNFQPAITEEDYNIVQRLSYRHILSKKHRYSFYPLRQMVYCDYCKKSMRVGPSTSEHGKRYLNYRCDNKSCIRNNKTLKPRIKAGIRSKFIFEFAYELLKNGLNFSEEEYKKYKHGIKYSSDNEREQNRITLNSKRGILKVVEREMKEISLKIINYEKNDPIWKLNREKIIDLEDQKNELLAEISKIEIKLANSSNDTLSQEQFLNLSKNAATKLKAADAVGKDAICRLIFLNFFVNDRKVVSYTLKEPFKTLFETRKKAKFLSGGHGGS